MAGAVPKVADFGLARAIDGDSRLTVDRPGGGDPGVHGPGAGRRGRGRPGGRRLRPGRGALPAPRPAGRRSGATTPIEVLQALAAAEPVAPRRLRPRPAARPGDDRAQGDREGARARYATAGAMAEDLRRFLAEPADPGPAARPSGPAGEVGGDAVRRWRRSRPRSAAVTVLAFTGITALWVDAAAARDRARAAAAEARQREAAERRARYQAVVAAAASALELNNVDAAPGPSGGRAGGAPRLGVAALRRPARHRAGRVPGGRQSPAGRSPSAPTAGRLASGSDDGAVGLWDAGPAG